MNIRENENENLQNVLVSENSLTLKTPLLETAIKLVENGYYILPIIPRQKTPITSYDYGFKNGLKDATNDVNKVLSYWMENSNANIGIRCGNDGSKICVVDIDVKSDINGFDTLDDIQHNTGNKLPDTFTVTTPSGGMHYYFKLKDEINIKSCKLPGIDIKSNGGYILYPPSETDTGYYDVFNNENKQIWEVELPYLPDWFISAISEQIKPTCDRSNLIPQNPPEGYSEEEAVLRALRYCRKIDNIKVGDRHNTFLNVINNLISGFGLTGKNLENVVYTFFDEKWLNPTQEDREEVAKLITDCAVYINSHGGIQYDKYTNIKTKLNKIRPEINVASPCDELAEFMGKHLSENCNFYIVNDCPAELIIDKDCIKTFVYQKDKFQSDVTAYYFRPVVYKENKDGSVETKRTDLDLKKSHIIYNTKSFRDQLNQLDYVFRTGIYYNGKLHYKSGYYADLKAYIICNDVSVPENITKEDVEEAKNLLSDKIYGEFKFASEADKCNAYAMLFESIFRPHIPLSPFYSISKPRAGSGATFLAKITSIIIEGKYSQARSEIKKGEEFKKDLLAALDEKPNFLIYDNQNRTIDNSDFNLFCTMEVYGTRRLGGNSNVGLKSNIVKIVTGINVGYNEESSRRVAEIYLNPNVEFTCDTHYKNEFLEDYVLDNRNTILRAMYILVQNWINEGSKLSSKSYDTFIYWGKYLGGFLESIGMNSLFDNSKKIRKQSELSDDDVDFIEGIYNLLQKFGHDPFECTFWNNDILQLEKRSNDVRLDEEIRRHINDKLNKKCNRPTTIMVKNNITFKEEELLVKIIKTDKTTGRRAWFKLVNMSQEKPSDIKTCEILPNKVNEFRKELQTRIIDNEEQKQDLLQEVKTTPINNDDDEDDVTMTEAELRDFENRYH